MRILFVCLGNICRSPTAEGVMRHVARREGLGDAIEVDSAGTGGWHVGDPPDERATATAKRRGITLDGAARRFTAGDFSDFDLILAMDEQNRRDILSLASDDDARAKVKLFREFDEDAVESGDLDVPDPYYGGPDGFEHVLDMAERATLGLIDDLRATGRLP
jgi:protein-tyrosine phosphatase